MEIALHLQRMVRHDIWARDHQEIGYVPYGRFVALIHQRHPQVHIGPTGLGYILELYLVPAEDELQVTLDTAFGFDHIVRKTLICSPA